ncbi:MAG: hypothetical protein V4623_06570 [Pseudomonadota bacterium]
MSPPPAPLSSLALIPAFSLIAALLLGAAPLNAQTQTSDAPSWLASSLRTLPSEARKGVLTQAANGMVVIDEQILPLAPAAQIRTQNNLIVQPMMLTLPVLIAYTRDATGAVFRIWMLNTAEVGTVNP